MFLQPTPNLDLMGENVTMIFAILTIFFMIRTRPRQTRVYIYDLLGMLMSVIGIALHVTVLLLPASGGVDYKTYFWCSVSFHAVYMVILNLIYAYAWQLSYKRRLRKKILLIEVLIFDVIYMGLYALMYTNDLIFYVDNGRICAGDCFSVYLLFGLADAIMTIISGIMRKADIPKTIFTYVMLFGFVDVFVLILQLMHPNIIFSSLTFVAPFLIYYLMFHSNPMDEVSGCRNLIAFETVYAQNRRLKRKCTILCGTINNLPSGFLSGYTERISYMISDKCRKIEALSLDLKLYTTNPTSYVTFIYGSEKKRNEIIKRIGEIIAEPVVIGNSSASVNYKLYRIDNYEKIENAARFFSFVQFLSKFHDTDIYTNQYYVAVEEDYVKFKERSIVADALLDIRKNRNLNDERVLCYAQPIHDVVGGTFRTAESLMRMNIDGKMYYPDTFIPVSEETNCIHVLTLIMLNKVCQKVKELEKTNDFECITVNCSTMEFADDHFADDVLEIIDSNGVDRSRIRLELTESSVSSYNMLMANMNRLKDSGISFYLDDFGTGYSNIDRILSCPFKTVKFDKSFLRKALSDEVMYVVTEGMVNALKQKGFLTLIEGVEDDEQRKQCVDIGFHYIQGYYYSKPVPIDELRGFFTKK